MPSAAWHAPPRGTLAAAVATASVSVTLLAAGWLQGNPCCEQLDYRLTVLAALPQLEVGSSSTRSRLLAY
jgi:hypothetical protein